MTFAIMRLGGLFFGSALFAFSLLAPQTASSAARRNIAGESCRVTPNGNYSGYRCPLNLDTTTYTVSALVGSYNDFYCPGSGTSVLYILNKYTYTGTLYSDSATYLCPSAGARSKFLTASNVKTNPTADDYLWGGVFNTSNLYGISFSFN